MIFINKFGFPIQLREISNSTLNIKLKLRRYNKNLPNAFLVARGTEKLDVILSVALESGFLETLRASYFLSVRDALDALYDAIVPITSIRLAILRATKRENECSFWSARARERLQARSEISMFRWSLCSVSASLNPFFRRGTFLRAVTKIFSQIPTSDADLRKVGRKEKNNERKIRETESAPSRLCLRTCPRHESIRLHFFW